MNSKYSFVGQMSPLLSALEEFCELLRVNYTPSKLFMDEASPFAAFASDGSRSIVFADSGQRRRSLLSAVNSKFRFNSRAVKALFDSAAKRGVVFNYHEKNAISKAFDDRDDEVISHLLEAHEPGLCAQLGIDVQSVALTDDETIARLHAELRSPTLTRKDSKPKDWSQEILEALFASYLSIVFGQESIHQFNSQEKTQYQPDYWKYLLRKNPHLHSDGPSLIYISASSDTGVAEMRERVAQSYALLPSFGHLAIWIRSDATTNVWPLFADTVLFAERHIVRDSSHGFFKPDEVAAATLAHNLGVSKSEARFESWHDGFYYQDGFIVGTGSPSLLLILQKRDADEARIPCPSCRTENVRGNSYASLGVKSWECKSLICPDRSKFGRGRRYSFVQILKQVAIDSADNEIPKESIRSWMRDVQPAKTESLALEMLIRHYTLVGDKVLVEGEFSNEHGFRALKRRVDRVQWEERPSLVNEFDDSAFFRRYDVDSPVQLVDCASAEVQIAEVGALIAVQADAFRFLSGLRENSIDGAVTSPPYYNAKEYSQWVNIYAYLYDMRAIAKEVFKVLKPGGYYLYNIFDYFDNENIVVSSAMGEKRIPLGAYTIDLFRRLGFVCEGNIVWDKGDIEGKRGFNGGNRSPFYQSPFNCWEHILVFRKPPCEEQGRLVFPTLLRHGAVIKMVRGENKHGHSAPFPVAVPKLLCDRLPRGSKILDPFAGSMTTAVAAAEAGCTALCIEQNAAYFKLGLERYRTYEMQRGQF